MIRAEQLCKSFERNVKSGRKNTKQEFLAVDHISLEAKEGEIIGILGPNGAGKTTLLRMLGNIMTPTEGNIMILNRDGEAITNDVELKKRIGYLSGNTKLYPRFSVREYLGFLGKIHEISKETCEERIEEIIEMLSMQEFCDNRMEKLSTGQTQRASIARCLLHDPSIFIFDEPTLGLDVLSADAIIHFMKKQKEKGKTVLYSTHYLEEAQFLCDRIYLINHGRIVSFGSPEELMEQTSSSDLRGAFHAIIKENAE